VDNNNVIELNGKRYDAVTGQYLGASHTKPIPATKRPVGRVMDGVMRPAARHNQITPVKAAKPVAARSRPVREHQPLHAAAHKPQNTKTLMRHAVAKPKPVAKPLKAKGLDKAPAHTMAIKESVSKVNPHRQQRANLVAQHQHVKRFQPVPLRSSVASTSVNRHTAPQSASRHITASPSVPKTQNPKEMFEAAIAHATSHEQPSPRVARRHHRRSRLMHASIAVAVVVLLGGAITWAQWSKIELQIVSWQAGFDARMPGYALTDYSRSPINKEHGALTVTYQSGDSFYQITQQRSSWNSQTLLDQDVAGSSTDKIQTIESKGRIIYIHGNSASWVDGGVRYDIAGNAPLTSEDILAIIDSM
jgi:hypothetical protein